MFYQPGWTMLLPDWERCQSEVHVWLAKLTRFPGDVQQLSALLSEVERERARCFSFERDRQRYIVARGLLRTLLGKYLGLEPGALQFVSGQYGKPQLAFPSENNPLRFNLSYSREFVLYALSWGREIGVDIEYVRPIEDIDALARYVFSPQEQTAFQGLPPDLKQQAFFNCWTCKEAYLKASGEGLSRPLRHITVSLLSEIPAQLFSVQDQPEEIRRWSLQTLPLPVEYAAAVAAEGHDWRVVYWEWD